MNSISKCSLASLSELAIKSGISFVCHNHDAAWRQKFNTNQTIFLSLISIKFWTPCSDANILFSDMFSMIC